MLSPLADQPARAGDPATARLAAMREVVAPRRARRARPWPRAASGPGCGRDAARLADEPDGHRLRAAPDAIERRHGADLVTLGGWHGDWGRWNMGMGDGRPPGLGLGALRPRGPGRLRRPPLTRPRASGRASARRGARRRRSCARSPDLLAELGVEPGLHDLTLRLYLLEIAVRYVDALTHGATPALRRRTSWVLVAAGAAVASTRSPPSSEGRP